MITHYMTEKKEKIIASALELFANEGYHAVPTHKIAKAAGVSEALIFRHFESKEGLLKAILEIGEESAERVFEIVMQETDPKTIIKLALELPYSIPLYQYKMWRLMYSLKWQTNTYNIATTEPFKKTLEGAFKQLGYADPKAEAELILLLIDGAATVLLLHEPKNKKAMIEALKLKYKV